MTRWQAIRPLPLLACGLLLIALFDFIGNYVRRGYAGELSLWVQRALRMRVHSTVFKNWTAQARTPCVPGGIISRTNSDLQQVHTLLQMCPVPLAVLTYIGRYRGDAMDVAIHDAYRDLRTGRPCCTALRARRCFRANGACLRPALAHMTEHMREVLEQISVVKSCVAGCAKRVGSMVGRGRWCGYASAPLSHGACRAQPCWRCR